VEQIVPLDTGTRGPTKALGRGGGGCGPDPIREFTRMTIFLGRNVSTNHQPPFRLELVLVDLSISGGFVEMR
jgi:hypothetical protein